MFDDRQCGGNPGRIIYCGTAEDNQQHFHEEAPDAFMSHDRADEDNVGPQEHIQKVHQEIGGLPEKRPQGDRDHRTNDQATE